MLLTILLLHFTGIQQVPKVLLLLENHSAVCIGGGIILPDQVLKQ